MWVCRARLGRVGARVCLRRPAGPDQRVVYTVLECQPLFDSSDMTISEWVDIAQTIEVPAGQRAWWRWGAGQG